MRLDPDMLRRAPAFASLPFDALEALALCFTMRRYAAGEVVFREGDPATTLFFLADGMLSVAGRGLATTSVPAGRLFGEAALIDPTPRPVTVRAAVASTVFELTEGALDTLRRACPPAARALRGAAIGAVMRRLRVLEQRVERSLESAGSLP
jgi:CRP-like cAMP-binding protein